VRQLTGLSGLKHWVGSLSSLLGKSIYSDSQELFLVKNPLLDRYSFQGELKYFQNINISFIIDVSFGLSCLLKIASFLNNHFCIDRSSWLLHLASFSHVAIVKGTDRTRKILLRHFMLKVLFTLTCASCHVILLP